MLKIACSVKKNKITWTKTSNLYSNHKLKHVVITVGLPETLLADVLPSDVPLFEVPLADVLYPMDPEVAEPVPEKESSWRIMFSMSLDEELASLLLASHCELVCKNKY